MVSPPVLRRRFFLAAALACGLGPTRNTRAEAKRFRIALANLDETPGVTLEGLGFTGSDVRRSFELAARTLPVDMLYFDNAGDPARAIANAEAAIGAKVDLLIEYNADVDANAEIARRLAAASIPALALVDPLPGARLYGPDNRAAGQLAGRAGIRGADRRPRRSWRRHQGPRAGDYRRRARVAPGAAACRARYRRTVGPRRRAVDEIPADATRPAAADSDTRRFGGCLRYARHRNESAAGRLRHRQPRARPEHPWRGQRKEGARPQQPRQRGPRLGCLLYGPLRL